VTRRRWLAILALATALAVPAAGAADGKSTLLPSFDLYDAWTDNFLLAPDHSHLPRVTAWSTSFQPGLRYRYDSFRTESWISVAADFLHVWNLRGYDGWPESVLGDIEWAYWASPSTRVTFGEQLTYYTDPRNQPFSSGRVIETLRTESINNRLFGQIAYMPDPLGRLDAAYAYVTTEFRDPTLWDTVDHQVTTLWTQQIAPSQKLMIFYNFNRVLFSHNYDFIRHFIDPHYKMVPGFPVALHNAYDFDTHTPGLGFQYLATPTWTVEMRSGVIVPCVEKGRLYEDPHLEWYERIDVTKLFWKMQLALSYNRDYAPAYGLAGAFVTQTVGGHLDERWSLKVETVQDLYYTNYSQPGTNLDTLTATVGATYYFYTWIGLGGSYNFTEQLGGPDGSRQRTTADLAQVRLSLGVPRPDWIRF
jgi:hypothetical protein